MAKRSFTFDSATDPSALIALGWPSKTAIEAWDFSVSVKDWTELLVSNHGKMLEMHALDGGDDPPDILVTFETGSIGFETTRLVPQKFAHFDNVIKDVRKTNCTVSPSLSGSAFQGKQDMINQALDLDSGWTLTENEVIAWTEEANNKFDKKAIKAGNDTFQYLVMFADSSHLGTTEAQAVVATLNRKIQSITNAVLSLILLIWTNPYQYESWLIRKGKPVLQMNRH